MFDKTDCRFDVQRVKGTGTTIMVIIDKTTGVNYLALNGGGITPLVHADGTPICTSNEI